MSILGKEIIAINDITLLRKALQEEEFIDVFSDRPNTFGAKYIFFNCNIVIGKNNKSVFTLRKMLHKGFKVFGEGVARFEYQVNDELDRLVSEINTQTGKDIHICSLLKKSFSNWMSSPITGHKAQHSDAEIIWEFNESLNRLGNRKNNFILAQLPCLRFLPGKFRTLYRNCIKARDRLLHRFYYTHGDESCALRKEAGGLLAALIQKQAEMNQQAGYEVVRDLRGLKSISFLVD